MTSKSFLLTTWEGGGSVSPVLTVARKLLARGHRVRVMSDACNRPEAEAAGAEFVAWTRAPSRLDRSKDSCPIKDWLAPTHLDGLKRTMDNVWTGPALAYAEDVIEELKREPADLVVTSEMLFGVAVGCDAVGQPYANLMVNVSLFPIPGVPPMGPGLPPAQTEEEKAMHAEAVQGNIALLDHGLPAVNAARQALGLEPLEHLVDQGRSAARMILATAKAFDFPAESLPAQFVYVGPQLGEPSWAGGWSSPFAADDRRPLVAIAFSTTYQGNAPVVQRVIDALAELPVRGVVTLGDGLSEDELTPARNVRVIRHASHDALMREAVLVVTHGGHGTVNRALVHERPMLVIPHGRDQADNAVRVAVRGAGLVLTPDAPTQAIRTAVERLLNEPSFSEAACRLGQAVAAEAASPAIVEELEALAGARETCAAA